MKTVLLAAIAVASGLFVGIAYYHVFVDHAISLEYQCEPTMPVAAPIPVTPKEIHPTVKPQEAPKQK